jgi:hypothetical protein
MANPFPFSVGAVLTAAQMNSIGEAAIAYTPTITAFSGTLTTTTSSAKYMRVNKLCVVQFTIGIVLNGTGAVAVNITLPFAGVAIYGNTAIGVARETGLTGSLCQIVQNGAGTASIFTFNNGYPGGTGANLTGTIIYEVA